MTSPHFNKEMHFKYGLPRRMLPGIHRLVAENPSPYTFHGTNSYVIGEGKDRAIIDPGPALSDHVDALLKAIDGATLSAIIVTHTHLDHTPACKPLQAATGALIFGFGPHPTANEAVDAEGNEPGDEVFRPNGNLGDGDTISGDGWSLTALHTPGHISNHLCFDFNHGEALLTGDHIMGWSTSIVSPPEGNMKAYFDSLDKVLAGNYPLLLPAHGPKIEDVQPYVQSLKAHRQMREVQIAEALEAGLTDVSAIVARLYPDLDKRLIVAAERTTLAHLEHMVATGRATPSVLMG